MNGKFLPSAAHGDLVAASVQPNRERVKRYDPPPGQEFVRRKNLEGRAFAEYQRAEDITFDRHFEIAAGKVT